MPKLHLKKTNQPRSSFLKHRSFLRPEWWWTQWLLCWSLNDRTLESGHFPTLKALLLPLYSLSEWFASLLEHHLQVLVVWNVCAQLVQLVLIPLLMRPRSRIRFHWVSPVHSHSWPPSQISYTCVFLVLLSYAAHQREWMDTSGLLEKYESAGLTDCGVLFPTFFPYRDEHHMQCGKITFL